MLEKIIKKFVENRANVAVGAAVASSPIAFDTFFDTMRSGTDGLDGALAAALKTATPWFVYLGVRVLGVVGASFGYDTSVQQRTRISDYSRVKKIKKELASAKAPTTNIAEGSEKKLSRKELMVRWREKYGSDQRALIKLSKESKRSSLAGAIIINSFASGEYDQGLSYLLNFADWYSKSKYKLTLSEKLICRLVRSASFLARQLVLRDTKTYLISAVYEALQNPSNAWYYSKLGCLVADEFNTPFRKEMHVFHALLASAQHRSDISEAWSDAVRVMREEPVWERMGNTRCVVRRLQNSKFFANAFVFKERESIDSLVEEADLLRSLQDACPSIAVPEVLHIAEEPFEGRYCLVTRFLPGKTLYERANEGFDDFDRVIPELAEVHSRFLPETVPISLEEKMLSKFSDLGAEGADFIDNSEPLFESFSYVPWVWSKDAHPENWIIGEKVGVIDCEGRLSVPCTFDLANLLEYDDYLSQERIVDYVSDYASSMNIEVNRAFIAYFNSVVYRMICLAGAWSSPDRQGKQQDILPALERASSAISRLQTYDSGFYGIYESEYQVIKKVIDELKCSYVS